jgi:hypothetical protein
MQRQVASRVCFWLCLLCGAIALGSPAARAGQEYKNVDKGYAFTIPDGWTEASPKEAPGKVMIYRISGAFKENVNIADFPSSAEEAKQFPTDAFPKEYEPSLRRAMHITSFAKPERTKVAGHFSWKFRYEAEFNGVNIRGTQWFVLNQARGYVVTWTDRADASHPGQVDELVKSFGFVGAGANPAGPAARAYRNSEKGFAFTIPNGWTEDHNDTGAAVSMSRPVAGGKESLNVRVFGMSDADAKAFVTDAFPGDCERQIRQKLNVQSFDTPERTIVAGQFAWKLRYLVEQNGVEVRTVQWAVRNGLQGYAISWGGRTEANIGEIEDLVKSFHFIPVAAKSADAAKHGTGRGAGHEYKNAEKGFAITIPDGWTQASAKETKATLMIYRVTGDFKENVNVRAFALPADEATAFTNKSFPKMVEANLRRSLHIKTFEKPEQTTLAGRFAWKMRYTMEINGRDCDGTLWAVANNAQAYAIAWVSRSDAAHGDQVDDLINSFRFISGKD